jgi:hypothetical protein
MAHKDNTSESKKEELNPVEKLTRSLEEAGVGFELDEEGNVNATPAVIKFLESKEALHTPGVETIRTKEDLMRGIGQEDAEVADEDRGYSFKELEGSKQVEEEIDKGTAHPGESKLEAKSKRHQNIEMYIGPIPELMNKICLVKRDPEDPLAVAVQFDDPRMILNSRALGYGWHEFPYPHISDTRSDLDKWGDSGDVGKWFLLNIICEDETHNKTLVIESDTPGKAKGLALSKHKKEFPDIEIKDIEIHEDTDQ